MFEIGYNTARRQDFGKHDDERGGGLGIGTGYRVYFNSERKAWFAETNFEFWWMSIDWKDRPGNSGTTDITIFQPTVGGGYLMRSKSEKWEATIGASFGREWNIKTVGDPVGEGGISLLTFSVTRKF